MKANADSLRAPAKGPIVQLIRPFQAFARNEAAGGILLLLCAVAALFWANSAWGEGYARLWHTEMTVRIAGTAVGKDLHFWVNEALMAVFFFVVGLEIKRELLVGELASARQAALPIAAALGGVVVPAAIYLGFNAGGPGARGWGIPMATDIAFAIGAMALLGERVPSGLKVFLTALAIVDDIVAVAVIALFYTSGTAWGALGLAAGCIVVLLAANRLGVRHPLPYALVGIALWGAVLHSGIHATIAGVALAFTIPARTQLRPREFLLHGQAVLDHFERAVQGDRTVINDEEQQAAVEAMEDACEKVQPPLYRLEQALHPWVTFFIMPLFALANAGVRISGNLAESLSAPVTLGVTLGLVFGKPLGVTLAAWLAVRTGVAALPQGTSWRHIHGAGWLAGIGFTMSLFVAGLAFAEGDLLMMAKLGILTGSLCAGAAGAALLRRGPVR